MKRFLAFLLLACCGAWAQCSSPVFDQKSIAALKQKAASGNDAAQCGLGMMYDMGTGVSQDFAQAALWLAKAAEQGDLDAEGPLGVLYRFGLGVPQDYAKALSLLTKAAKHGVDGAQLNLADMYHLGQGVPRDDAQAAIWYRKAAEQGLAKAQRGLAESLLNGWGVPQNTKAAMAWFQKAAVQGDPDSQYMLGQLYHDGGPLQLVIDSEGKNRAIQATGDAAIPKDLALAAMWYRKAADRGDARAQWSLAVSYRDGDGVPQDYAEAYFWFDLAAAGMPDANETRDDAASHLTKTVLLETQDRARKWFEDHPAKSQ